MEASRPADGERSGRQEEQQPASAEPGPLQPPQQQQQQPTNPRRGGLGRLPLHRQPKRSDLLLRLQQQQAVAWRQHSDAAGPSRGGSFLSPQPSSASPLAPGTSSQQGVQPQPQPQPSQEGGCPPEVGGQTTSSRRGDKKPPKPGKYVCTYCGRPCAKPSVLQKHIRSHTGERPYPCVPCGFSFKTKSNLYKHRKSHAHRIKAGLAPPGEAGLSGTEGPGEAPGEEPEEAPTEGESTDSEEETGEHRHKDRPPAPGGGPEEAPRPEDSQAVKQRLAMRLSERKRGPLRASPDTTPSSSLSTSSSSSLGPGSKGSTESGYFSGSGCSTELSQVSPPSASVKTYAEIILGKYGRLGAQQQRGAHHHPPHHQHLNPPSASSSGEWEKPGMSFSVPNTQVIEHITKLITINEAVVDTSEIDSVKPRRSSLSRKSSSESVKLSAPKDPYATPYDPKGEAAAPSAQDPSAVPLFRSHSVPSDPSACAPSPRGGGRRRLSHSFDEQQAVMAEMRVGHAQRLLKRQPAIEVPLGAELLLEGAGTSPSPSSSSSARGAEPDRTPPHHPQQHHHQHQQQFECAACGAPCLQKESYEAHRASCPGQQPRAEPERRDAALDAGGRRREDRPPETTAGGKQREDRPQMMHYKFRALAMAVRKRRKEESLEEDPPSPGPVPPSPGTSSAPPQPGRSTATPPPEHSHAPSGVPFQAEAQHQHQDRKGVSVIQHTSSFEKQDSVMMSTEGQPPHHHDPPESPAAAQQQVPPPQPKASAAPPTSSPRLLQRQRNIQVPEILVTVEPDTDMPSVSPPATVASAKEPEKVEEFQWPQRSQSMAQLPAEKLPPKKKRLRLADVSQSSGESLPRSPSQESNVSYTSSSLQESSVADEAGRPGPGGQQQGSQMLTVPSSSSSSHQSQQQQQQREMRRSASEQSPASPGQADQSAEASRSKSFDLGSLSPQHPAAAAWKERRKCLLVKHATLGKPEQEEGRAESPKAGPSTRYSPPEAAGKSLQLFQPHRVLPPLSQGSALALQPRTWEAGFPHLPAAAASTVISEVLSGSAHIVHRYRPIQVHPAPIQVHPAQIHMAERLGIPLHQLPSSLLPIHFPSGSRAAYLPGPSRLTIQVPGEARPCTSTSSSSTSPPSPAHHHHHQSLVPRSFSSFRPRPVIITCLAQLTPVVSLVVPVRLQTHMPPYASAMNTTLSQMLASSARLQQDPICCTTMVIMGHLERRDKMMHGSYLKIPAPPDLQGYLPLPLALQPAPLASGSASDEALGGYCGPLGAGGSKRMLSPAASLELSTEAQRLKKRVKEEEEEEEVEEEEVEQKREGQQEEEEAREEKESKATGSKLEEEEEEEEKDVASVKVEEEQKKEEQNVPKTSQEVEKEEEEAMKEAKPKREEEEEVTVEQREGVAPGGRVATPQRSAPQSPERPSVAAASSAAIPGSIPGPPSYPSLDTATSVNWCYLNYVKPNPWAQGDPRTSVYSTWSVSVHNPNLPGVSTKVALSLLCSKQRHSAQTYTMATGSLGGATTDRSYKLSAASGTMATGPLGGPDGSHKAAAAGSSSGSTPQCVSEVHAAPPGAPLQVKEPPPPPHREDKKKGKREEEEEDGASTSKQGEQPPRVRIFEGGYRSSEEYVYVRGRGRGRYVCSECGIRCKKPSMLRKHIRTHTDVRPYVCRYCNFAFKTKGNLTKHMKSKAHGKKCQAMGVSESSLDEPESEEASGGSEERVHGSEEQQEEEHQFSDVDESDEDEENEEDEEEEGEESSSHDEPPSSSCSSHDTHPSTVGRSSSGGGTRRSQQGTPDPEPSSSLSRSQEKVSPRRPWPEPPAGLSPSRSQEKASPRRRPWPGGRKATSPGSQRAVYSRRGGGGGWNAGPRPRAFSSPSSESCSPSRSLSPRLDLSFSPVRSLSPRLDVSFSPVRSLSPRLDVSFSPVRSLSPRTDLSSPGARHLSPSPERGPSPVRAASASPLRCGSGFRSARRSQVSPSPLKLQHYRPPAHLPWESPGSKRAWERSGTAAGEVPMSPEATSFPPAAFRLSPGDGHSGHQGAVDHVFSHLPMHSQQAKVPYLMIPIGGIQMVQAGPRSHPTTTTHQHHPSSPTSPPTEGPSLAMFEWSSWGWTPRTQGLRTPGRPWSEGQGAGSGQRPQPETRDSKQYGSLYSFTHTHHHHLLHRTTPRCVVAAAESAERSRDSHLRPPLNRTAPSSSSSSSSSSLHAIGQPPEWEEPRSVAEPVEGGGAKGETDRSDQSTSRA